MARSLPLSLPRLGVVMLDPGEYRPQSGNDLPIFDVVRGAHT
jgi:hypothetical protein